jgi:hypothetical protein
MLFCGGVFLATDYADLRRLITQIYPADFLSFCLFFYRCDFANNAEAFINSCSLAKYPTTVLMKKSFLSFLFLVILSSLMAQKAAVKWGPELDLDTKVYRFLGETANSFFVLSGHKDDLYLDRFNSATFKLELSKKLDAPKLEGQEQDIESIIMLNGEFVLFTSLYSNKLNNFSVHSYTIDKDGVVSTDSKEILSLEAQSRREAGEVNFIVSNDSTRILVCHTAIFRKEKVQRLTMTVIDNKMATLTTAKVDFPIMEGSDQFSLSNYSINNSGELFFLETKVTPARKKEPMVITHTIISYGIDGQRKKDFPIELDGKRVDQLFFSFDVKENLLVSGFYETKSSSGIFNYYGISGTFFMSIDKESGQEKAKTFQEFDHDLLASCLTPKQMERSPMLPNDYVPREILQKDDGGVVSVYEEYSYSYSSGHGQAIEVTYYGNLLITNINPDGTIKWVKLVPKHQIFIQRKAEIGIGIGGPGASLSVGHMVNLKSDQTIYYSYLLALKDDKIILVFNDDPANQEMKTSNETEMMKKIKGAIPMMVTLTEDGEMTKKTLFEATDFDIIIRPQIAFQSSDTRILIYGSKGDKDKFGVLTIE